MEVQHSIQYAAQRAGITPHVIRAWEKRYGVVSPVRTESNRRLYSDEDIERLRVLAQLTNHGHRISDIAHHPTATLVQLMDTWQVDSDTTAEPFPPFSQEQTIQDAIEAVQSLNAHALNHVLHQSALKLGQRGLLERLISPLARRIGELWSEGKMSAAHEHFASNLLKVFLLSGARAYADSDQAPTMIVTTPIGQHHELGAAMVAAYARDLGWRVKYLGSSLPAVDIAHAASGTAAKAVVLSIVHPADDGSLISELRSLRRLLPSRIAIIVGGESAKAYERQLRETEIIFTNDLGVFAQYLTKLRQGVSESQTPDATTQKR